MKQILEGSRAIALTIKNIKPGVISAYPITPQTHIVEDLAKFKADGEADYEFVRAESEFAAASITVGASATGVRVYPATSSQGLLLMSEVVYNIAGMRLPVVMTCANRAVSAPINIWNDQQDVHAVAHAGWVMLFAENNQEAVDQHILAYKIAEQLNLPAMVNVDGFVLTHTYEPVTIFSEKQISRFLKPYKPKKGSYLDPKNPITIGAFAGPATYMEIREDLQDDLISSLDVIKKEYAEFQKIFDSKEKEKSVVIDNGLLEYYGSRFPKVVLVAMGSVIGTIKEAVDELHSKKIFNDIGILKIKTFRPFPGDEINAILQKAKCVAVIEKAISLGSMGPLAIDLKAAAQGKVKAKIQSFIVGLGGRDITKEMIKKIINDVQKKDDGVKFIGKI